MSILDPTDPTASLLLAPTEGQAEQRTPFTVAALRLIGVCLVILTAIGVGFTLYAAREFLMPIAIALLLAIMLSPVARRLERRISATASAALITIGLVGLLAGLLYLTLPELAVLADRMPEHMRQIEDKITAFRSAFSGLERASQEIQEATQQVGVASDNEPVVVQQVSPLAVALTSIARVATQTAAALLLTFFLLAQRRRMKVIIVAMANNHSTKKRLISMFIDIKTRISGYLLAITLTSIGLGAAAAVALYLIGFPNPFLWGVAVAVANFVPYAGPAAVQVLALIVGALTSTTVWEAVTPALIIWVLNFVESQIVSPMVVAKRVVLNPLSVFVAIVFGGWIWGVVGAVVAVPALIVGASVIQHWWAPCSTENRRPILPQPRIWQFYSTVPSFRLRRTGLHVRARDIERV
ncbi:MAG TPA: AI-2E family transporter [Vitreimonas sp.]|nr:AI-2E family transporter [Vitreimonas sp.]